MGVLQDFERRLEGAVDGFFARAFKAGVQPVELAKALQRYAGDHQQVGVDGIVVPNHYRFVLSTKDHARLAGFGASLPRELAGVVTVTASERGWTLRGPARIELEPDEEIRVGRWELLGRVAASQPDPATPREHATPPVPAAPAGAPRVGRRSQPSPPRPQPGPPRTTAPRVHVRSGGAERTVDLRHRTVVGRAPTATLRLEDTTVSREHAALEPHEGHWWVVDLGSANGTRLNGRRELDRPLRDGDRITFGEAVVEFREG